jgi:hypothetical protein
MRAESTSRLDRPTPVEWLSRRPALRGPTLAVYAAWFRVWYRATWARRNAPARRAFVATPPALTETQRTLVTALRDAGIAHVSYADLLGDPARWAGLCRLVEEWLATPGVRRAGSRPGAAPPRVKEDYLVRFLRRQGRDVLLPWDCPWLRLAVEPAILDIANSYLGMWSRLYHLDLWSTVAAEPGAPRIGAQRWHRDPADLVLLKVFLYFSDVTVESGALQYVPGSRRHERYGRLWRHPMFDFGAGRPPPENLAGRIPPSEWVTCAHPRGTLVFVDTTGFHRGGHAVRGERVLATWAYSTPASRWRRAFRLDGATAPASLSPAARHALLA